MQFMDTLHWGLSVLETTKKVVLVLCRGQVEQVLFEIEITKIRLIELPERLQPQSRPSSLAQ